MTKPPTIAARVLPASGPSSDRGEGARPLVETRASAVDTARLVADFTTELSSLARHARLDLLAYLLDMARLEAVRIVQAEQAKP